MAGLTVVDTDILIDAGRGVKEALDYLQELERSAGLAVSVVIQMELLVGCRNKAELRALEQFFRRFRILKIDETISDKAVELLQQYRLSHGLFARARSDSRGPAAGTQTRRFPSSPEQR